MMKFSLITFFTLSAMNIYGQENAQLRIHKVNYDSLQTVVNVSREGRGNSTFSTAPQKLLSIIKNKFTLKMLESQLGKWNSNGYENTVSLEYDKKTDDQDIPLFEIHYNTSVGKAYYELIAEVRNSFRGRIKEFTVKTIMNGLTLAKFKESLKSNGFLINENLSALLGKETWQKDGQPSIAIVNNWSRVTIVVF